MGHTNKLTYCYQSVIFKTIFFYAVIEICPDNSLWHESSRNNEQTFLETGELSSSSAACLLWPLAFPLLLIVLLFELLPGLELLELPESSPSESLFSLLLPRAFNKSPSDLAFDSLKSFCNYKK